ncbi:MAG: hypothetical protein RMI85_05635, partial [Candidatus Korarchaeum sp.]|nr:hypothetical protein [Candidatus Korarchaeum sp.]
MSITPELYEFIVRVVEEKVREIRVTREEFEKLRVVVERNIEAITRLEAAVERLSEAQARAEERLSRLEAAVEKLTTAVSDLRSELGRLSDAVGYGLEDIARMLVPPWLERFQGVRPLSELRREFLRLDGEEIEIDLYSEGIKEGRTVRIVGEVKSRIYGGDVRKLYSSAVNPLRRAGFEVIAFMVGYVVHPSAREE